MTVRRQRAEGARQREGGAALAAIEEAGGGLVEAYPDQVEGREPQRGSYLHTGRRTCSRPASVLALRDNLQTRPPDDQPCSRAWSREHRGVVGEWMQKECRP